MIVLQDWLEMPLTELAAVVSKNNISVKVALDGSTRHYLLAHPNDDGIVHDFEDYARHGGAAMLGLLDTLFSTGIHTVLFTGVWPGDLDRRDNHVLNIVNGVSRLLLSEPAIELFARWGVRVVLYGDWDISPVYEEARPILKALAETLHERTSGDRLFELGFSGQSFADEILLRGSALRDELGRLPTLDELRTVCFPLGPQKLDIYIGSGKLSTDNTGIPPLLNRGVNIYLVPHLPLDLTTHELRLILFDYLFLRSAFSFTAVMAYKPDLLDTLRAYYKEHSQCVIGLGELIGGVFWVPFHPHKTSDGGQFA
jgi:hypothetical protein